MRRLRSLVSTAILAVALGGAPMLVGGCAPAHTRVGVGAGVTFVSPTRPPPPRRVSVQPRPGFVWAPGHWVRVDRGWAWREGRWIRAQPDQRYVPGRWVQRRDGRWQFVQPRWERRVRYRGPYRGELDQPAPGAETGQRPVAAAADLPDFAAW